MADLSTAQVGFQSGSIVSSDDTLLSDSASTMNWADTPTYNVVGAGEHNGIDIAFTFGSSTDSCACTIFAARDQSDYAKVWTGTLTAGTMETDEDTVRYYCDEITNSTETWITGITEADARGNNRMAHIMFDFCGYSNVVIQFTGLSGESVRPIWAGY